MKNITSSLTKFLLRFRFFKKRYFSIDYHKSGKVRFGREEDFTRINFWLFRVCFSVDKPVFYENQEEGINVFRFREIQVIQTLNGLLFLYHKSGCSQQFNQVCFDTINSESDIRRIGKHCCRALFPDIQWSYDQPIPIIKNLLDRNNPKETERFLIECIRYAQDEFEDWDNPLASGAGSPVD